MLNFLIVHFKNGERLSVISSDTRTTTGIIFNLFVPRNEEPYPMCVLSVNAEQYSSWNGETDFFVSNITWGTCVWSFPQCLLPVKRKRNKQKKKKKENIT
jgi:hypothetical protein